MHRRLFFPDEYITIELNQITYSPSFDKPQPLKTNVHPPYMFWAKYDTGWSFNQGAYVMHSFSYQKYISR